MAMLKWDGREFDLAQRPTVKDAIWIEATVGKPLSKMGEAETFAITILLTLRKQGVALTWDDVIGMDMDAFDIIDDEEESDPTAPGVEAGTTSPSPAS
jgi:hypothetical protein